MKTEPGRKKNSRNGEWDSIIEPINQFVTVNLKDILQYKFLVFLFIKRDFQTAFKQTILGPLWFVIQPIMTSGIYSIIFAGIAGISTDKIPAPVFYMAGTVMWTFFQNILMSNSSILTSNSGLFGKVYFPRLAVPLATSLSKLYNFGIQFILFLIVYLFYIIKGVPLAPTWWILAVPIGMLQLAVLGVGFGLWASAWTVKYRDLTQFISFGMGLWMWATPIVYPMSFIKNELLRTIIWFNPAAQAIEMFRSAFTGYGAINPLWMLYSWSVSIIIFVIGLGLFNKAERTYIDVV